MNKRFGSVLSFAALIVGGLSAAGQKAAEPAASAAAPTEISMQISWAEDSGRGKAIREILDAFEAENSDVKVRLLGGNQTNQKILTMVLSGEAPEIIQANYQNVRGLAREGAFQAVGKDFSAESTVFHELPWRLGQAKGIQYGIPWMGHSVQLVYNVDLFRAAGIAAPPKDWNELYAFAQKLTVDKNGDGKIDQWGIGLAGKQDNDILWMVNMFMHQGGASLVKESGGKSVVALNSPEGKAALDFYIKLIKECAPPDSGNKNGADIMNDFRNQVVAMELQGPWGVTDIWKTGKPFAVGSAPVPSGPAGRFADIGLEYLTIPDGIKGAKRDAAVRAVKFLASKKGQEMLMKGEIAPDGKYYPFRVPIRKDMADTEYFRANPIFTPFIEGFAYPSISSPVESWFQVEQEVYRSELNKAVVGMTTVEAALSMVEKQGNEILSR
jgi:ABC-type glycerol-3-phosphate transport system substrate-binding protein